MKINITLLTLLCSLFCLQTVFAQETFLRIYPSPDGKDIYSICETDDNHLI